VGEHRIVCGDCTDAAVVARVMAGERAQLLCTDPPYNVSYVGKTSDTLTIENDSMNADDFDTFLNSFLSRAYGAMVSGGVFYICAPSGRIETQFRNAISNHLILSQCIVWVKDRFVLGHSDYHYKHESILYGWSKGSHKFYGDGTLDTVWEVDRPSASRDHPTMKPIELFERMIENSSLTGEIILAPFAGSGTTGVAAHRLGRRARMIEISPAYCAVILERMAALGLTPQLLERAA